VTDLVPEGDEELEDGDLLPPAGVPLNRGGPEIDEIPPAVLDPSLQGSLDGSSGFASPLARVLRSIEGNAEGLSQGAELQAQSLEALMVQLEDKRSRLLTMPSIWPAKGWLTSRFGPRVSPFTGRRQVHGGIDIAAASGTSIHAPARGRVVFAGRKGPLGNALVVDHGFGVKTVYGHTKEIHVGTGETVERGQKIAAIGTSGRSTGPHLHYVVEVNGKSRDPLDYIFD
jgi:murein DD-endopeptidase MepM/ murein hydrolase activator NlpD